MKKVAYGLGAALVFVLTPVAALADCSAHCKRYCVDAGYREGTNTYSACFTGCIGNRDPSTCQSEV